MRIARNASTSAPAQTSTTIDSAAIDTLSLDDIDFSTTAISAAEKIGYLKEIGLDYGWGPTSIVEYMIEHFHIWAGLPWWASIAAAAVSIRLVLLPLFIKSADNGAKMQTLKPITSAMMEKYQAHLKAGNMLQAQQEMAKYSLVRKDAGVNMKMMFLPMILQGMIGYGGFRFLTAAAALPVPGLYTGGALWFTDLTVPDGYLILPVVLGFATHLMIRLGGETGSTDPLQSQVRNFLLYGMPIIVTGITGFQSAALAVWFTSTTSMGILQALLLKNPAFRSAFGIAQMTTAPVSPQQGIMDKVKEMSDRFAYAQPAPEEASVRAAPQYQGRIAYTRPVYQAPTIRSQSTQKGSIIDTKLASTTKTSSGAAPSSTRSSTIGSTGADGTSERRRRPQRRR